MPRASARRIALGGVRASFGFDVTNQELSKVLTERQVPHEFHLRSGGHGRAYHTKYVSDSMTFHARQFQGEARDGEGSEPSKED